MVIENKYPVLTELFVIGNTFTFWHYVCYTKE